MLVIPVYFLNILNFIHGLYFFFASLSEILFLIIKNKLNEYIFQSFLNKGFFFFIIIIISNSSFARMTKVNSSFLTFFLREFAS